MHTREFIVNAAAPGEPIRVNLRALVNNADIQRDVMHNGRLHMVVPSYTLPDDVVMNGGLYPADEIAASYTSLEGTLAPLGHPQLDGKYVSAQLPEAINANHIGAFNRNVEKRGNRVYLEKWVDVEFAKNSEGGRALLAAIEAGDPVHTSTGIFMSRDMAANGEGYEWTARDMRFDHDAILINEIGAATPEQGVGLMVNVAEARPLVANLGARVLAADSNRSRFQEMSAAVRAKFGSEEHYACLEDFDGATLVYCTPEGNFSASYTRGEDGALVIGEPTAPVVEQSAYFEKNSLLRKVARLLGLSVDSEASNPTVNAEADDMKPEELQAALTAQAEALTATFNTLLEPIVDKIGKLETNLQANTAAEETEQRTRVAEVLGQDVADGLTGNALAAAFKRCNSAAPLLMGLPVTNKSDAGDRLDQLPE